MNLKVHHIGIVVDDIDASKKFHQQVFGLEEKGRYIVDAFKSECCFLLAGNTYIELIKPLADDGLKRFLEKHGSGTLHHICYLTDDIDAAVLELSNRKGLRCLSPEPVCAPTFKSVVFFHPKDTGNVLFELVSEPACPLPPASGS